jgi:hypothetical protein
MRKPAPIAALLALLAAAPAAAMLQHGDLVLTDRAGGRLWQVEPGRGVARVFSPPVGVTNLLVSPTDVATTSGRGVYVADQHSILAIDPDSGAQYPLTTILFSPGGPLFVPMVFDGFVAGLDADANGALWAVEDRGSSGRLWKITRGLFSWSRQLIHDTADLGRIGNGLAVTSDDDGNANDVFFTTLTAGMLNVDVGSGDTNEILADVPPGVSSSFAGNIDALGDCEDLACSVLFSRATWPIGGNSCTASQVYVYFIAFIVGGVEPLDYVLPCASAVAALSASDAYVLMVDFREIGVGTPTRVLRFHSDDGGAGRGELARSTRHAVERRSNPLQGR